MREAWMNATRGIPLGAVCAILTTQRVTELVLRYKVARMDKGPAFHWEDWKPNFKQRLRRS